MPRRYSGLAGMMLDRAKRTAHRTPEDNMARADMAEAMWPDPEQREGYAWMLVKGQAYMEWSWSKRLALDSCVIVCRSKAEALELRAKHGDGLAESSARATV